MYVIKIINLHVFVLKKNNNNNKINKIGEGVKLVVGTAFLKIKIKIKQLPHYP